MDTRYTRPVRGELGFVLCVAVLGIALVLVVALAPWYEPMMMG